MASPYGLCIKCLKLKYLTKHHIYPQRYSKGPAEPVFCYICRECHTNLERKIRAEESKGGNERKKLNRKEYLRIAIEFIKGG